MATETIATEKMATEKMDGRVRIAIAGAGVSGFATLGYLVNSLRDLPLGAVTLYWLQPPRKICTDNLSASQRDRLTQLKNRGLDPSQLLGGGLVYHPVQPSLFTFNGNSAARGFNFVAERYDTNDYFEWVQSNRDWLVALYPDFAPEKGQQRHPEHTLDDIQGTTPRGAFGLYLHAQVLALKAHLPEHITLQIVPEALQSVEQAEQTVTLKTGTRQLSVDYLVEATGPRFSKLRPEWDGRVFRAYPCDRIALPATDRSNHNSLSHNLPPQVTVVGAGASGIEVALHLLHNLGVGQVTLVSRRAQSRLPQVEPTEAYECQWFTRENMRRQPTAKNAQALLQKELEACYEACYLAYPGWDELLNIKDYPSFLEDYLKATEETTGRATEKTTNLSPNHPLAHLVRPVMSFYGQVKDLLPEVEQIALLQLINRVKPLFATQSRPCAELMLAALKTNRLRLIAGEFLPALTTPTIVQPDGTQLHPDCVILATGFDPSIPPFYPQAGHPQSSRTCRYQVMGTSLSAVHKQAANAAKEIASDVSKKLADRAFLGCRLYEKAKPT
ncbi:MAG: FAD/NAD(P)-binding protein [Cyanobacteria bacterium J06632_3]